ncbi:hypothetical protein K3495_g14526 [Podosphaera aphanis]|nr:hypothetical protein K3495_g14526 [Podosphaera aphanis]
MRSLFLISSFFLLLLSSFISAAPFPPSDQPASAIDERRSLERRRPELRTCDGVMCSGKAKPYTLTESQRLRVIEIYNKHKQGQQSNMHPGSQKEKIP